MAEARHTYDYGLIGNCSYQAHIHLDSNIEWMCWPRFDSSFIFGSMLDKEKGGEFAIRPAEEMVDSRQYYVENTNILCTEITCNTSWSPAITEQSNDRPSQSVSDNLIANSLD